MIDLERRLGPLSLRTWTLVANLLANALLLYGLALKLDGRGGALYLVVGGAATLVCLVVLSQPSR